MDTTSECCVPPGFRFHPTDEELVGYYLRKKVASQKIDLDVIRDIDLYRIEPWDLQDKCRIGYEEQKEWYFFSHKDKKYPTGTRTNRATMAGFWKATGRDKAVYDRTKLIGMRKTLVFYKGRAPNGLKTDWIMHEYRLESEENGPPQEEGWVVCRAFKKKASTGQTKNSNQGWDSTYYYHDHHEPISGVTSSSVDYITSQQPSNNFLSHNNLICKQEIEVSDNLHFVQSDQFVQLPELESPSLPPLTKRNNNINELDDDRFIRPGSSSKKVTDWRDLDKFVASQLSHGDRYDDLDVGPGIDSHCTDSDLELLLLQSGREEAAGPRLNDISTSDCDIGICIFNK
ncbi:hypothetical protein DH2020_015638 [Rehmannia glutinosa]|uniref:NAC domain-containing protein n=1 Tax=Rehmannia glutinosa TaxID=99300 RepID=A0ABR0WVT8_REHGL